MRAIYYGAGQGSDFLTMLPPRYGVYSYCFDSYHHYLATAHSQVGQIIHGTSKVRSSDVYLVFSTDLLPGLLSMLAHGRSIA